MSATVKLKGKDFDVSEVCRRHSIDRRTLLCRLSRGWPPEKAVSAPVRTYPKGVRRERTLKAARRQAEPLPQRTLPSQLLDDAAVLIDDFALYVESMQITTPRGSRFVHAAREWRRRFSSRPTQ